MKKKMTVIVITAIIIAIALVSYNLWNMKNKQNELLVTQNGAEIARVTVNDIIADTHTTTDTFSQARNGGMPALERNLTVLSLEQFIVNCGVKVHDITNITVFALDGFCVSYKADEVVYIAVQEGGAPLATENGAFCMVVPQDDNSKRWLRQVCEISFEVK